MNQFEEAYAKLNPRQKQAVDAIEGPVMVIAGPGTGKTQILTLRIANILKKTDTPADAILALTFTESAAANMRRRLVNMIGSRGYYVNIFTFHGFSNRVIQDHPNYFPEIVGAENASQVDQIALVRWILEHGDFVELKPFGDPFFYVQEILKAVRDLKSEGVGPAAFEAMNARARKSFEAIPDLYHIKGPWKGKMKGEYQRKLAYLEKNEELARAYRTYHEELRTKKLYDFEDMILETIKALATRENFLLEIQEKYQYILVDEHQDTNGAQNRLLELLASFYPNPNLFVVGDEKQAIFRFQGASLENFLYFKNKYPEATLVNLAENYRSTQAILDAAHSLIGHNKATLKAELRSERKEHGEKIHVYSFDIAEAEQMFLADMIEVRLKAGVPLKEIAVLYRDNKDAFPVSDFLEKRGVPIVIESDQNVLSDPEIRKLILLFETVSDFGNDERLAMALHIDFLGIEPLDIYKLTEASNTAREPLYRLLASPERLRNLDLENPEPLHEFYLKLKGWKTRSQNEIFLQFFERIMRESGYLTHILGTPGYLEHMDRVNALFEELKKMVGNRGNFRLSNFIDHLLILREHGVMLKSRTSRVPNAVRLMTAHKAKGLEFDTVFIVNVTDGHWGNKRSRTHFDLPFERATDATELERNEDERRIFYMALTRARKEAFVSYATRSADGKEQVPSQFIEEIHPELKEGHQGREIEEKFLAARDVMFAPRKKSEPTVHDLEFLKDLFIKRGLSATALNNYLECPWKYFYNNLVRIPSVQRRHQMYGSAVHAALQDLFEMHKEDPAVGKKYLVARFEYHASKNPVKEKDLALILGKGGEVLPLYFDHSAKEWNWNVRTEFKIQISLTEEIQLKGNLDKLELDNSSHEVNVVDYKTGAPKSRNWIEGKTEDSNGNYKRQLVFYKLLLDRHPEKKYAMKSGTIDFVEPNERGKFKKEEFVIADGETEELEALIRKVAGEILSLSFWNSRCGEKKCEYCALRDMMKV